MTLAHVVDAMIRRWYVPLVVLMVAAALTVNLMKSGGLYSTRTVVIFVNIGPHQVAIGPDNGSQNASIIAFAGAVANDVNNGRPVFGYALPDAPLYGAGVSKGVFVGLRDDGGQWGASFGRAEVEIEIVGPTREYVESLQQELLAKVYTRARELQGPAYDDPTTRILTQVVPLTLAIEHISASGSQRLMALAAMFGAATIVGGWGAVRLEADRRGLSARRGKLMTRTEPIPEVSQ